MPPSDQFTISQLAANAGIPTTTVRYYERIGLLEPEGRSAGNYRLYGRASLEKLRFIKAAQAIGFTLDDIRALLADASGAPPKCGDVQSLIEARLEDIEARLKDLRHVRKVLKAALEQCRTQKPTDCCHVVAHLRSRTA
ncbi:MAG: heavy metal-responsive transcriptional regulator [Planctomycetota bacterium]|nr:MAG: heavy metal-responsive transcriptional regulator [Planctomycetota bacterium]